MQGTFLNTVWAHVVKMRVAIIMRILLLLGTVPFSAGTLLGHFDVFILTECSLSTVKAYFCVIDDNPFLNVPHSYQAVLVSYGSS